MEIKKNISGFEVIFESAKFLFDPPNLKESNDYSLILTDKEKNINQYKIFNSPGEYNVGEVNFLGFDNEKDLIYLFEENKFFLLYFQKYLTENVKKQIKLFTKEIELIFSPYLTDVEIVKEFKSKLVLTFKNINLPKFKKVKGEKIKINPKKVGSLVFIFS